VPAGVAAAALAVAVPRMYAAIRRCAFVIQRIHQLHLMPQIEREVQHSVQCRVAGQKPILLATAEAYHFEGLVDDGAPSPVNLCKRF